MASVDVIVAVTILFVLQPTIASSNDLFSPLMPPAIGDVCEKVDCGKGKCKTSQNSTLFYECECDLGWKQTLSDQNDPPKFLPCIVPNCTLNHACTQAPAPVQEKSTKDNESIFDFCHWIDCGGGLCNKTSMFAYSCECTADHYNILNVSTFPCFKECAIGMDCKDLGISMPLPPPPAPALADNSQNQAASDLLGNGHWLILLMMSLALLKLG